HISDRPGSIACPTRSSRTGQMRAPPARRSAHAAATVPALHDAASRSAALVPAVAVPRWTRPRGPPWRGCWENQRIWCAAEVEHPSETVPDPGRIHHKRLEPDAKGPRTGLVNGLDIAVPPQRSKRWKLHTADRGDPQLQSQSTDVVAAFVQGVGAKGGKHGNDDETDRDCQHSLGRRRGGAW